MLKKTMLRTQLSAQDPVEGLRDWFRQLPMPKYKWQSPWATSLFEVTGFEKPNNLTSTLASKGSTFPTFGFCIMPEGLNQVLFLMECDSRILRALKELKSLEILMPQKIGYGRTICLVRLWDAKFEKKDPVRHFLEHGVGIAVVSWTGKRTAFLLEGIEDSITKAVGDLRASGYVIRIFGRPFGFPTIPLRDMKGSFEMIFNHAFYGYFKGRIGSGLPSVTSHSKKILKWLFKYGYFGAPRGEFLAGAPLPKNKFEKEFIWQHELSFMINYDMRCPSCRRDLVSRTVLVPRRVGYSMWYIRQGQRTKPIIDPDELEIHKALYDDKIPMPSRCNKNCRKKLERAGFSRSRIDVHAETVMHALVRALLELLGESTEQDLDMRHRILDLICGKGKKRPGEPLEIIRERIPGQNHLETL